MFFCAGTAGFTHMWCMEVSRYVSARMLVVFENDFSVADRGAVSADLMSKAAGATREIIHMI